MVAAVQTGASAAGGVGGVGAGAGAATFFGAAFTGFGATFFTTALILACAFFPTALTAFLMALPAFLAFAFTFAGCALFLATFFLATLRLAAPPLAFTAERFFFDLLFVDLLFFAMVTLLLEIVRTRCESSPEKVCCHLCVTLESIAHIAYAARVLPAESIRPLKDVWLRPRRVFRELAIRPVGVLDYALAAAQGVVNFLALFRAQSAGAHTGVAEILGESFVFGPIGGVVGLWLFAAIYGRLGKRVGAAPARNQVIHVLAYGGLPVVASLGIWVLTALLAGETTFIETPRSDAEEFVVLLVHAQFGAYVLLLLWSIVLQVMGFSEIQGIATRKAFWVWILGQVVGLLAAIFLSVIIATLFPGVVPH